MWSLNNTILSGSKNTLKKDLKNLETNGNEDTAYQNLLTKPKGGIFTVIIVINTYIKKRAKPQISKLSLYCKELEDNETKPEINRMKEITKIRVEINETVSSLKKSKHLGINSLTKVLPVTWIFLLLLSRSK